MKEARGLPNGTATLEITAAERDRCRRGDYEWAERPGTWVTDQSGDMGNS